MAEYLKKNTGIFDDELEKVYYVKRLGARLPKEKNSQNTKKSSYFSHSKNGFSYTEKCYQSRGSSANFQKATKHSKEHNERLENDKEPKYLLPNEYRKENEFWNCGESEKDIFQRELEYYKENHKGGRIPKFENSKWEAVINLNHTHTIADAQKVAEHIAKKFNFTATRIALHRDEGHFEKGENGEKVVVYNYHAHLNFITLKNARQNMRREHITAQKLSELQTEIAEILQMERGEKVLDHERKHNKKHKSGREYAQEQKMLETLESLNKQEISAEVENLRKKSKEQGYSQEYFKALSNLKRDLLQEQNIKINELQEKLRRFELENAELKKENERLKAEKQAQAEKIKQLEKENQELKQELAQKTQNEPKPSQDINQSQETQENAPKELIQSENDLKRLQELDKMPIISKNELILIFQRLEMRRELEILRTKDEKISPPSDFIYTATQLLKKQISKEKEQQILNQAQKAYKPQVITQSYTQKAQEKKRE